MINSIEILLVALLIVNVILVGAVWRRQLSRRSAWPFLWKVLNVNHWLFPSPPPHRHYAVTDLGDLAGHGSFAYGINSEDQVVGSSYLLDGTTRHAVMWDQAHIKDLGTLPGATNSEAHGINDSGLVVGWSGASQYGPCHGFIWAADVMTDLGALPGDRDSRATAINAAGHVVGYSGPWSSGPHPFVFQGGVMAELALFGSTGGAANAINTPGQIVGGAYTMTSIWHAFMYVWPTITDLGTVAGTWSEAYGVNDSAVVVGASSDSTNQGTGTAFRFAAGSMRDLGTLGGDRAYALAINNNGVIVGNAENGEVEPWGSPARRAFVSTGRGMWDLNRLIPAGSDWTLESATGINAADHIVGWGHTNHGQSVHGFLLTPLD